MIIFRCMNTQSIKLIYSVAAEKTGEIILRVGDVKLVRQKNNKWVDLTLKTEAQERLWLKSQNLRVQGDAQELRNFFQTATPQAGMQSPQTQLLRHI